MSAGAPGDEDGAVPHEPARAGQGSVALKTLRRIANIVIPISLASMMILPAFRAEQMDGRLLELRTWLAGYMRPMSLSQQWGMYAPDPARSMGYMLLKSMNEDGTATPLEETPKAYADWGTVWGWQKTRIDIWRYRLSTKKPGRPSRDRGWYMRGVCVREARKGEMTRYMQMEQLSRVFTKPHKVRAGKPGFGPERVKRSDRGWCGSPLVDEMVELDKTNNPQLWTAKGLAAWEAAQ